MKRLFLVVALLVLAGCTVNRGGVEHHLIIGFGVVTVARTNQPSVLAVKVDALGLQISDAPGPKVSAGLLSTISIQVPDDASNVVVEATAGIGKLKLKTQ